MNSNVWGMASRQFQDIIVLMSKMTKMRGGLNLIPKILKKHEAGCTDCNNPNSNGKKSKKRANLTAKNKAHTEILALK